MRRLFICALVLTGGILRGDDQQPDRSPATQPAPFKCKSIAIPPQQNNAWAMPQSKLPEKLLTAIDPLFVLGMADPRGCEYHQVQVAIGNVWNGGGDAVQTHGWVIPANPADPQRFVVCWNGLVYPAVSVGKKADVSADVAGILKADQRARDDYNQRQKNDKDIFPYRRSWGVTPESEAVSFQTMTLLKPCMLLRLGETALAEDDWAQLAPQKDADGNDDPYLMLASEWAWCTWDRAVCAHMRGDDVASLAGAKLLEAARPQIETTAAARKFKRPIAMDPNNFNRELPNPPYLGTTYDAVSELVADEARRVAAKPLPLDQSEKIPDKARRIAAIIADFEEVAERQWGQPGGVGVDSSPIAQAIEKEGEDAVEPLLQCLEHDKRLTRSVSFGRDFAPGRNLIPVGEVAYLSLGHILQTTDFGSGSDEFNRGGGGSGKTLAAEIRAFWKRNKGKSPAERWYTTLADDTADPSQWVEAAKMIVQPADVEERGGWVNEPHRKPGEIPPMRGEELRKLHDPSVAELLARRVPQITSSSEGNSGAIFRAGDATSVALALEKWEPNAAAPVLRAQIEDCKAKSVYWSRYADVASLARNITDLSTALTATGDKNAFKEYANWIVSKQPERESGFDEAKPFEVMWQHPDDPDIAAAAEKIFGNPASPWYSRPKDGDLGEGAGNDLIASPLLALPAFCKNVLGNLSDTTKIGTVTVDENQVQVTTDKGGGIGFGANPDPADPLVPKPKQGRILRVCDWYASRLSTLDDSPVFELYWPQENRDAAIKEFADFVQQWGPAFRYTELQKSLSEPGFESPHMTFPQRDRPATDVEVKAHTAIFAFPPGSAARVVALKRFPVRAKWTTLTRFRLRFQGTDAKTGEVKIITEYDQRGLVWQAEEVQQNGTWRRYYGFVANHIIAKVPAEEVQLFETADPSDPTVR